MIDFVDFVKAQRLGEFLSSYLGKMKPDDFELVGFSDEYGRFTAKLSQLLGIALNADIIMRKGRKGVIAPQQIETVGRLLEADIVLYQEYRKYWGKGAGSP